MVDDERAALRELERALHKVAAGAEITLFESGRQALEHAHSQRVDVAFLDIAMDGMNGLVLAKALKDIRGDINIIFVTGYSSYMGNAFELHASGYVLKPFHAERVADELENLRRPVPSADTGIRIQCFGSFEVFANGVPVEFGRARSKELLALLVDRRGATVSRKEMAAVLWEDGAYTRSRQTQLQVYIAEMTRSLQGAGAQGLVIKKRGLFAVDVSGADCDYYHYINGDISVVNRYHGEYMRNYSWAEFTTGCIK